MASYRGVRKEDLIGSIRLARAFLKKLNLGPAANRELGELLGQDVLDKLQFARNDLALYSAVKDTDIRATLTRFLKVIRFHALTDQSAAGQASEAMNVYTKLMSWSAFFPAEDENHVSPVDEEIRSHLISAMANALQPEDEDPDSAAQKRLTDLIDDVREEETLRKERDQRKANEEPSKDGADSRHAGETARWLTDMIPLVISLGKLGGCEAEIRQLLRTNSAGADIIPRALEAMLDLDQREAKLNIKTPISRYKVVFALPTGNVDQVKNAIVDVADIIIDTLSPYFYGDELESNIDIDVEKDGSGIGISIYTTREAAQYLADSLPANLKVLDSRGQRVARRSPPSSSPAPGPL